MNINDQWDRLDPDTQTWLTDNPGCLILPRTITATICQESGKGIRCDDHGQMMLSQEDRDFIQLRPNDPRTPPRSTTSFRQTNPDPPPRVSGSSLLPKPLNTTVPSPAVCRK